MKIFIFFILISFNAFADCHYSFFSSSSSNLFKEMNLDCLDGGYMVGQTFTIKISGNEYFCSYKKDPNFSCYYEVSYND